MAKNLYQRGIRHSSEQVMKLIDARVNEISSLGNQSISYIIENAILDGLFPKNKDARSIVVNYLYADYDDSGVKKTLDCLFAWNNAGVDLNSKYDNLRPIVEFTLFNIDGDPLLPKSNGAMHSFLYAFDSVIKRAEKELNMFESIIDKSQYLCSLEYAKTLLEQAKDKTVQIGIKFFFEVLLDLWNLIKGWSMTYRALSALASMSTFHENPETRNSLVETIDDVSKEW